MHVRLFSVSFKSNYHAWWIIYPDSQWWSFVKPQIVSWSNYRWCAEWKFARRADDYWPCSREWHRSSLSVHVSVDFLNSDIAAGSTYVPICAHWTVKTASRCSSKRDGVILGESLDVWGRGRPSGDGNDPCLIYVSASHPANHHCPGPTWHFRRWSHGTSLVCVTHRPSS